MSKVIIEEEIRHGDTEQTRYIDVDLSNIEAVIDMLNSCSYLRLPEPDFGKGAVLVSRTYEEIVADRRADAERIARALAETGEAELGWVAYSVVDERPWWA